MSGVHGRRKPREITGPTPHSLAIRAKASVGNQAERLLIEQRRKEALRNEAIRITNCNRSFDLKNDWERNTDLTIMRNKIKNQVNELIEQRKSQLEERKLKLRRLLTSEERAYIEEMEANHETIEETQKKMIERARMLKEKRELRRLEVVREKRDQQWRDQCAELRSILSRRHLNEVCADRKQQIALKAEFERKRQEEDAVYAKLWEEDRLAKAAREELEEQKRIERNCAMVGVLRTQKAALLAKKEEEKLLLAQEAQLLKEEIEIRKMEDQRVLLQKKIIQQEFKKTLDDSIKMKMRRQTQERQEELALDMKLMEKLMQETRNEAGEIVLKKLQRKEAEAKYRNYLQQQLKEEQEREKNLDVLIEEDVAAMWSKRMNHWRKEKEARDRMMQDVMETRRKQLKEKLEVVLHERDELRRERRDMIKATEEYEKDEDGKLQRQKDKNRNHEVNVLAQIDHVQRMRQNEKMEEVREFEEGVQAEVEYQAKLEQVLSNASDHQKTHPMKRMAAQPQFKVVGREMK